MMKAAVLSAPRNVGLQSVPSPEGGADDALVRVEYCAIGGTCLRIYRGDFAGAVYPNIPGLEIVGTVHATGAQVKDLVVGQRVAIEPILTCGTCSACRAGRYNCCVELRLLGIHEPGGMAEFVVVPAARAHPVPSELPPLAAAVCEPFSIAVQAIERVGVGAGDDVVVLGCGIIGLAVLMIARARGARVLAVEPNAHRRATAARLGADAVDAGDLDALGGAVSDFTGGEGASVVIDAAGEPSAIAATPSLVAPGGRIGLLGVTGEPVSISPLTIMRKEIDLYGSRNCCGRFPAAIDFVAANRGVAESLIERVWPLAEVAEAFDFADRQGPETLLTVIEVAPPG
jgi:2-desacetyl-2-hydroxyethyl bacteriochlorophyllide A dehydrogenase